MNNWFIKIQREFKREMSLFFSKLCFYPCLEKSFFPKLDHILRRFQHLGSFPVLRIATFWKTRPDEKVSSSPKHSHLPSSDPVQRGSWLVTTVAHASLPPPPPSPWFLTLPGSGHRKKGFCSFSSDTTKVFY